MQGVSGNYCDRVTRCCAQHRTLAPLMMAIGIIFSLGGILAAGFLFPHIGNQGLAVGIYAVSISLLFFSIAHQMNKPSAAPAEPIAPPVSLIQEAEMAPGKNESSDEEILQRSFLSCSQQEYEQIFPKNGESRKALFSKLNDNQVWHLTPFFSTEDLRLLDKAQYPFLSYQKISKQAFDFLFSEDSLASTSFSELSVLQLAHCKQHFSQTHKNFIIQKLTHPPSPFIPDTRYAWLATEEPIRKQPNALRDSFFTPPSITPPGGSLEVPETPTNAERFAKHYSDARCMELPLHVLGQSHAFLSQKQYAQISDTLGFVITKPRHKP